MVEAAAPIQANGSDCGLHALSAAEALLGAQAEEDPLETYLSSTTSKGKDLMKRVGCLRVEIVLLVRGLRRIRVSE